MFGVPPRKRLLVERLRGVYFGLPPGIHTVFATCAALRLRHQSPACSRFQPVAAAHFARAATNAPQIGLATGNCLDYLSER